MVMEAKVVTDFYDTVKIALPLVGKFPRSHRFTLGDRIENRLLDVLELFDRVQVGHQVIRPG